MSTKHYRGDLGNTLHNAVLWQINKLFNDPEIREKVAEEVISLMRVKNLFDGLNTDSLTNQYAQLLKKQGYVRLEPALDAQKIKDMVAYFESVSETEPEQTLRHYKIADIFQAPNALDLATRPEILASVGSFLGTVPTIIDICAWWSHSTDADAFGAQIPHRDRDDFRFCKLFVYLTDVDSESGPHMYLPGSHSKEGMARLCQNHGLNPSDADKAFQTNSRASADWILSTFGSDMIEFTGTAGTMFLINTFGYHFGKVRRQSSRLVLQADYGLMGYSYRTNRLVQTHHLTLPARIANDPIASFACRLIGDHGA